MLKRVDNWFHRYWWKFKRFVITIKVEVYPKSPHFPPLVNVYVEWFKSYSHKVDEFRVDWTEDYDINFDMLLRRVPWLHNVDVEYTEELLHQIFQLKEERQRGPRTN